MPLPKMSVDGSCLKHPPAVNNEPSGKHRVAAKRHAAMKRHPAVKWHPAPKNELALTACCKDGATGGVLPP